MKCLLCSQEPTNINDLKENYVALHRVNPENWFLKNLFEGKNEIFRPRKCFCCTDFIPTLEEKIFTILLDITRTCKSDFLSQNHWTWNNTD